MIGGAALAALLLTLLLAPAVARAHDPFEITTDAHVMGEHLNLHTTMSLMTATRSCFKGQAALRIIRPEEFERFRGGFEECARDFYVVTSGGQVLPVRHVGVALTVEADVDMKVSVARPTKTPLVFDAVHLRPMVARAGVVLTVTGERSFLAQEVLRPEAPRLEISIGPDAEAPRPEPDKHVQGGPSRVLLGLGLALLVTLALFWRLRRRRR
jgi:hypothetical protein